MAGWNIRRTDAELSTPLPNPCPFRKFETQDTQVAFVQLFRCRICSAFADHEVGQIDPKCRKQYTKCV